MEDVTQYFMLQLMENTSAPLTEETYSKLCDDGKKKFVVGDIPVSYLKKQGDVIALQLVSLKNALVETANRKFVEMRNDVPLFDFEG
jgi:hypothetical protein